jgi:hypothetical protein
VSGAARQEYDKRVNRVIDHIRERLAAPSSGRRRRCSAGAR